MTPKELAIWPIRERRNKVGDEPAIGGVSGRQDDARTHGRMAIQGGRYLARFDTNPVDRHLIVYATQELQLPVRPPASKVTGAIHDVVDFATGVTGQEALFGQIRTILIAAGD
jgi:hypothetical protein